jgi:hypothetical protein
MRTIWLAALLLGATLAHAQSGGTKKELVARLLQSQQGAIEGIARNLAERPAVQMMQAAGPVLERMPADRRASVGRQVEAEIRKFVDEATPLLRERAVKLAPSTYGAALEERFSEEELRQLVAWFESPVNRKYQQAAPEMQNAFVQKLVAEGSPLIDPKLQALQTRVRELLGVTAAAPAAPPPAASAARPARAPAAAPPARAASK